jgi:ATP-binding cassette subfamily B protein
MKIIAYFWKKRLPWLIFLIGFTTVTTVVMMIFPYILKDMIDGIKLRFAREDLVIYVLILGGIGILRAFFSTVLPYLRGRTNEQFLLTERNSIFSKILRKGHSFTNKFPAGDILQRLDHDLNELCWFTCSGIFRPIQGIIMIAIALFFLIKINPLLTVIAMLPMSLATFGWLKIAPVMYKYYYAWREMISKANNHLQSSFSGIKLIKSYTIEDKTHGRFKDILQKRIETAVRVIKVEALINTLFISIEEIGIILILLFGGIFIIRGYLTIGEFVAFNAYILLLLDPMIRIGNFFVAKKRAQVQHERTEQIKNSLPDVVDKGKLEKIADRTINLENVSFQYSKDSPLVLEGINVNIPFGKKIGFAGTVGSGKTTLVKLLMRIADPTKGSITIGKTNIEDIPLSELRSLFGYIPQEPILFSDTIHKNVVLGRKFDEERIDNSVKLAQLADFVNNAPKGMSELIGERGLKLSGGEKQRVAIARALLAQPKILLLDDATSNLDAETEKELVTRLSQATDTTMVIISHRLSILSICDHIYVLDKGRVIEQGTHDALLQKRGLYWKLYQYQIT